MGEAGPRDVVEELKVATLGRAQCDHEVPGRWIRLNESLDLVVAIHMIVVSGAFFDGRIVLVRQLDGE